MKPGMRMMMADRVRQGDRPQRSEYGGDGGRRMIGYDRDGPGRERHYPPMDGPDRERRYPPMGMPHPERNYPPMGMPYPGWEHPPYMPYGGDREPYEEGPEARRRRDRRGRYMMANMEPDDDDGDDKYRLKNGKMITGAVWMDGSKPERVDEHKAMEWTSRMRSPDGSTGPHYRPEQAEQLRAAHCPKCDRWEFLVALNMMYADYAEVAKKFGADKPEFYTCMAKAFLEDPDAGEGKLAKYMEVILA